MCDSFNEQFSYASNQSVSNTNENDNRVNDISYAASEDDDAEVHSGNVQTHGPKRKRVGKKSQMPKKRKLRPEDERTLKLLTEKFRTNENNAAVCQIKHCRSKPMQSTKPSNLKRHLSQMHPETYKELFPHDVSKEKQIEMDIYNVMQDAIELVTVNGYPFSMLNASGMRGFIQARVQPLQSKCQRLPINRVDIVKQVAKASDEIRNQIKSEVKGKMISLMFDMCTIKTLGMIGVNATHMVNGHVISRSLGIIQINERHTAVNLANKVFDILTDFEIPLTNVFSVTTDNAKNAANTSRILDLVAKSSDEMAEQSIFDIGHDGDDQIDFGIDLENEIELQRIIDEGAEYTHLIEQVAKGVAEQNNDIILINQVNCGTHTFQLGINDSLAESNSLETIAKVHDMCVLMRTQVVMIHIRKLDGHIILPPLDTAVRWNSKYLMVCKLVYKRI